MEDINNAMTPPPAPVQPKPRLFWWIISGLVVGFFVGLVLSIIHPALLLVGLIGGPVAFGIIGAKRKVQTIAAVSNEGLNKNEKIVAWIFCLIAPVIAGGVMYYMWRHTYPEKAKQANNISWGAFAIDFIISAILNIAILRK